ncbi:unnamed protein product [Eruca vesicaria subsp. sativa]|uniref:Uncharacterized protein n=1 Tax=Eruca vesicaria subsp. sativa TaxID=29727 RepID=A0ABC8K0J6_ERUVS|nr:unnamed protein product [Eruca vesicaria subsp. sativa]
MVQSLIPGLMDDVAELCLSRVPRSSFRIISQVCWGWTRFLRSERYGAVRKLTGSVEELMCVKVNNNNWEVFDCSGNKLGRIPPSPGPSWVGGLRHAVLDGQRIVVFGGKSARVPSADVYEFNPATNRWRKLADMNIPRSGFTYAVVDGLLYVNQGYSSDDVRILNSEVYNPKTNQWSLMDCPKSHGFGGFAFSFNSKLFVVGGNRRAAHILLFRVKHTLMMIIFSGERSRFIDIYDPKTEIWEKLDTGPLSVYSYTVLRNKVYFFEWFTPGMGVFDPEKNALSSVFVPPNNKCEFRYTIGQWNNKVILFSEGREALSGDLDKEDTPKWTTTPIKTSYHHATSVLINF